MSILEKLKEDHNEVRELFKKTDQILESFPAINEEEAGALAEILMATIEAHNRVEEDIFYEALKEKNQNLILPYASYEEHHIAEALLDSLLNDELDVEERGAKLRVLKKVVLQHLDEEESTVFKCAEECLSSKEQDELGKQFIENKNKILREP